ncbi:hypothetical protein D3C87_1144720 [compost metagenome]
MQRRGVQALDVIQRDRWVDQETEHAGTEHVPERGSDEELQRPAQPCHPRRALFQAPVLPGFMPEQYQRHHFQRAEGRADSHHRGGGPGEVDVMERTGHTAKHEQRGRAEGGGGGQALGDQPHAGENEGQGGGGEHFEKAFDPQVHDPPTPVLHDRQMGALAIEQASAVEQTDGDYRRGQQRQQVLVAGLTQGREHRAQHQHQPEHDPGELGDLPQTTQINIFVTLMPEPEAPLRRHQLGDGEEVAGIRTNDHQRQRPEQYIHAELLPFRIFAAIDERRQKQPCREEASGDPEHRTLQMPGSGQRVGEPLR